MVLAAVWTLNGVVIAGMVAFVVDARAGRRSSDAGLRTELREVRVDLRQIAETQAEMNGQLVVLRTMAHTHDAT
jgi:hypothetical protein